MLRASCLFLITVAGTAQAEGPSFDCAKASSAAEQLLCSDADLAALDLVLADRFKAALRQTSELPEAMAELKAVQRGWIKGRDECWKADDLRACVEQAYLLREGELVARYLLDEPVEVVDWICDGNPANALRTWFFQTTLPSVRFERGDSVDAGSLAMSASGSRYEGSFGRELWIKGNEAMYTEPDGQTLACIAQD